MNKQLLKKSIKKHQHQPKYKQTNKRFLNINVTREGPRKDFLSNETA